MADYSGVVVEEPFHLNASVVLPREVMHRVLQVNCTPSFDCDGNDVFVLHVWKVSFVAC